MLIYVESELMRQIGANVLANTEKSSRLQGKITIGVPALNLELAREIASSKSLISVMPETLAQSVYNSYERQSVPTALNLIRASNSSVEEAQVVPGSALLISGVIDFGGVDLSNFNPLEPPEISLKKYRLHGEDVLVASLCEKPFFIPVYFAYSARDHIPYAEGQSVTVLGVCKWVPAYRPGSGSPVELAIRVSALWIN